MTMWIRDIDGTEALRHMASDPAVVYEWNGSQYRVDGSVFLQRTVPLLPTSLTHWEESRISHCDLLKIGWEQVAPVNLKEQRQQAMRLCRTSLPKETP